MENHRKICTRIRRNRIEAGLCEKCGAQTEDGRIMCPPCSEKMAARLRAERKNRVLNGLCAACRQPTAADSVFCFRHWLAVMSRCSTGSAKNWSALQNMWEKQDGRCVYTGIQLEPAKNANVDHNIPKSRGGDNSLDNLQWVAAAVNNLKYNLTGAEFIALCRLVAARADAIEAGKTPPSASGVLLEILSRPAALTRSNNKRRKLQRQSQSNSPA
jgi:hypothetical protein